MRAIMHRPGIEPGAGRIIEMISRMATANFTTKPPMQWKIWWSIEI
jgi:hypothetical protein